MNRKLTLFLVCAFEIALILFVVAWSAWANDANSFFKRYNSPEYGKHTMQCPDEDGGATTFSVSNNHIQMYGVDLGYAEKNGNTNQYYIERPFGGVLAGISIFLDFDQRVCIQLVNGQEIFSVKCKYPPAATTTEVYTSDYWMTFALSPYCGKLDQVGVLSIKRRKFR